MASWSALLDGGEAQRALAMARSLGQNVVATPVKLDGSLARGHAGVALLCDQWGRVEPDGGFDDAVGRHLDAVAGQPGDDSLFYGAAGFAWVCCRYLGEDAAADEGLQPLFAALRRRLPGCIAGMGPGLLGGLTGVGVYLLDAGEHELVGTVVDALADRFDGVAWRMPPPRHRPERAPQGYYNLGVAHGVPGIVAFLGRVCGEAEPPAAVRARALLERVVPWLVSQGDPAPFPEWTGPGVPREATGLGWCYGDVGVACALLGAARGARVSAWEEPALALARRAADSQAVAEDHLCHGIAGAAHMFNRLHQATGDGVLADAARRWYARLLDRPAPAEVGFLTGGSGIALALLAAATDVAPDWDRVLLMPTATAAGPTPAPADR